MPAFYIGPCRIRINFSFFALIAFCCIFTGAKGGLACFLAICVHEAAHLAVMGSFGVWPDEAVLSTLGCRVKVSGQNILTDRQNIWVSMAGPVINWLSVALAYVLGASGSGFASASLALALAHSLPIEPLDGGLALRYLFRGVFSYEKAEKLSRIISTIFLIPLATFGFLVLLRTRCNYSLLALSVYLMLYLVLKWDLTQP